MQLFYLQLELPAYSGAFLLTVDNFSFFTYSWSFFDYNFSFFAYSWRSFAHSGKVRLIRALRDRKQRSLTVSTKAPTVSKKASPLLIPQVIIVCACMVPLEPRNSWVEKFLSWGLSLQSQLRDSSVQRLLGSGISLDWGIPRVRGSRYPKVSIREWFWASPNTGRPKLLHFKFRKQFLM